MNFRQLVVMLAGNTVFIVILLLVIGIGWEAELAVLFAYVLGVVVGLDIGAHEEDDEDEDAEWSE